MKIAGLIKVPKRLVKDVTTLRALLSVKNPEYEAVKYSKWAGRETPDEYLDYLLETKKHFIVPRNIPKSLLRIKGAKIEDLRTIGKPFKNKDAKFLGKQRAYQAEYLATIDEEETDIIYQIPCGHGKTILALNRALKLKRKTLVFVPDEYLAKQWVSRVTTFCKNVSVAHLKLDSTKTIQDIDITIITYITYNSIVKRILNKNQCYSESLREEMLSTIGHVVIDEGHRIGAPTYHPIISDFAAKYRTTLTATFRRGDGMHTILQTHFGKVYSMPSQFPPSEIYPLLFSDNPQTLFIPENISSKAMLRFVPTFMEYLESRDLIINQYGNIVEVNNDLSLIANSVENDFERGRFDERVRKMLLYFHSKLEQGYKTPIYDSFVSSNGVRNKKQLILLKKFLEAGRCVLFLSKRRDILDSFHAHFTSLGYKSALVVGGASKDPKLQQYVEKEAQIIFGIMQLAQQGLDCDRLDTLILNHSIKDIEQAKGRIERVPPTGDKKQPLVIYPLDGSNYSRNLIRQMQKTKGEAIVRRPYTYNQLLKEFELKGWLNL